MKLSIRSWKSTEWLKRLRCFYKIKNNGLPSYLAELIPSESQWHNTWNTRNITTYSCRTDAFKYSFFPWTINEWNKLNFNIQTSSFNNIFTANLIKIIQPMPNSAFAILNLLGFKLITKLQLGLRHLDEHGFNHNFNICINPLSYAAWTLSKQFTILSIATTIVYYNSARISLLNNLNSVDRTLLNLSDLSLVNVLL